MTALPQLPLDWSLLLLAPLTPALANDPGTPLTPPPDPLAALEGPWRLGEAIGAPEWLEIGGEFRPRYEYLSEDFRRGREGSVSSLNSRFLMDATASHGNWRLTGELQDGRASFVDIEDDSSAAETVYRTALVNQLELLQAFVGYGDEDFDVKAGRQTIILGSRRHVHRNGYRNTINAFTGVRAKRMFEDGSVLNAFYVVPIRRLPNEVSEIENDQVEFDTEQWGTRFSTLHYKTPLLGSGYSTELYVYGLDENDREGTATRDRQLITVGARIDHPAEPGEHVFEWESCYQFGTSKLSTAADAEELDHSAFFHHLTLGYRFDSWGTPRAELLFDYASGDEDPDDGKNQRYDGLYGVPAFEWGVTGIFAPFDRINAISPGARVEFQPTAKTRAELMFRSVWLESDTDVWSRAGLRDPTGQSGSYIGDLTQLRVRHDLIPKSVQLDVGAAYLHGQEFMEAAAAAAPGAPNYGPGSSNVAYFWVGMLFTF